MWQMQSVYTFSHILGQCWGTLTDRSARDAVSPVQPGWDHGVKQRFYSPTPAAVLTHMGIILSPE